VTADKFVAALTYLVVALLGALGAWIWYTQSRWWLLGYLALLIAGWAAERIGRRRLPDHPLAALRALEGWILLPVGIAAALSALAIIIGVALAAGTTAPEWTKQTLGAVSGAITVFFSMLVLKRFSDGDDVSAGRIKGIFEAKYFRDGDAEVQPAGTCRLVRDSCSVKYVFYNEPIATWGVSDRWKRVRALTSKLAKDRLPPLPPPAPPAK